MKKVKSTNPITTSASLLDREAQKDEVLQLITEECAEVIQAISKVKRFGLDTLYKGSTKKELLIQEVGDVLCLLIIVNLKYPELFSEEELGKAIRKKLTKLKGLYPYLEDVNLDEAFGVKENE